MSEPSRKPFVGQRGCYIMVGIWEKQLTTEAELFRVLKVLFLSTPELSNADQEMEAEGVHGGWPLLLDILLEDSLLIMCPLL